MTPPRISRLRAVLLTSGLLLAIQAPASAQLGFGGMGGGYGGYGGMGGGYGGMGGGYGGMGGGYGGFGGVYGGMGGGYGGLGGGSEGSAVDLAGAMEGSREATGAMVVMA